MPTNAGAAAAPRKFRPTHKQIAYAVAFADAIVKGLDTSDVSLCKVAGVSRSQIPRWRAADDGFDEWLDEFMRRMFKRTMSKILLRFASLAMRGSVKHAEFFARYSGEIAKDDLPADAEVNVNHYTVINLAPRPGQAPPLNITPPAPVERIR